MIECVLHLGDEHGRVMQLHPGDIDEDRCVLRSGIWVYVFTSETDEHGRRIAVAKWD